MENDRVTIRFTVELEIEELKRLAGVLNPGMLARVPVSPPVNSYRLLTSTDTAELLGISKSSLYGLRYVGEAPPPVKIGSRLRWRRSDVDAWMETRLEDRPAPRW